MIYQPEKQKNNILVDFEPKGLAAPSVGSFPLDKITEDLVQTEAITFFTRVVSAIASPPREDAPLV
jgi:hypothetical protein